MQKSHVMPHFTLFILNNLPNLFRNVSLKPETVSYCFLKFQHCNFIVF